MSEDISPILKEWDEAPDSERIRKIIGSDGKEKIQIRVQFGLLQMEADGRPDGKMPYGKESLLNHYISILETYKEEHGTDEGFTLDHYDCERLRDESLQYYQRYITLFELEDYERADRDTARNLRALELIKKYAEREDDAISFEKYKPYIKMMNARARAYVAMKDYNYAEALNHVVEAIDSITDFYRENEYDDNQIEESQELEILKEMVKEIREKWEEV